VVRISRILVVTLVCLLLSPSILPPVITVSQSKPPASTTKNYYADKIHLGLHNKGVEHMGVYCWENVTLTREGYADLEITMEVYSEKLVNLYKSALKFPDVDEEVRERFLKALSLEQEMLFGFHIAEFKNLDVTQTSASTIFLHITASAIPRYIGAEEIGNVIKIEIESASPGSVKEFLGQQISLTNLLMQSFDGYQIFVKEIHLRFFTDNETTIEDQSIERGRYLINGCTVELTPASYPENSYMKIRVTVNENKKRIDGKGDLDVSLFSIKLSTDSSSFDKTVLSFEGDNNANKSVYDIPWSWAMDFDPVHLEGEENGIYYSIDLDFYLAFDGILHYAARDWCNYEVWVNTLVIAGLETYIYVSGEFEKTWSIPLYPAKNLSYKSYGWCGDLAVEIVVLPSVEAEITVEAEGYIYASLFPEAQFDLVAGGYLTINWGYPPLIYTPKFSYTMGGSFDKSFEAEFEAKIIPGMKFRLAVLLYGVVGPELTAHPYLDGRFGFNTDTGLWWRADLYIDLLVGVNFLAEIRWEWPAPICHVILKRWKGGNPPGEDTTPPVTTLSVGPMDRGYVGKKLYLWFNATDKGKVVSGVKTTKYRLPEAQDNSWKELDYPVDDYVRERSPKKDFNIEFYSIDKAGNKEAKNVLPLKADLKDPDSYLEFEGPYIDYDGEVFHILRNKTEVLLLGKDIGSRRTDYRVWLLVEHEGELMVINCTRWFNCDDSYKRGWGCIFHDTGNYKVKWIVEDKVGNCNYREITLVVKDRLEEASIAITFPKMGDFVILDGFLVLHSPFYTKRVFIACRYVHCEAQTTGDVIKKVEFECDGKTVVKEYPDEDSIYRARIRGVSAGEHLLTVRGYNYCNEVVAEDCVKILVLIPID